MSLRKLLSRDTNSKEKQIKILQVKHTVTNISKILSMLHPKVLHGDLKFSCTAEKSKMQHQILTALGKIMSHKQLIQDQLNKGNFFLALEVSVLNIYYTPL